MNEEEYYELVAEYMIIYNALNYYKDSMNEVEFDNMESEEIKSVIDNFDDFMKKLDFLSNKYLCKANFII